MSDLQQPSGLALATYVLLGGVMGLIAVVVTRTVYLIEDSFERLPVHWMWWDAFAARCTSFGTWQSAVGTIPEALWATKRQLQPKLKADTR